MRGLLLFLFVWPLAGAALGAERLVLENAQWRISIDATTLAIEAVPAGQAAIAASEGMPAHEVTDFVATSEGGSWSWDGGAHAVAVALSGADLNFTIGAREAGELAFIAQPAAAFGRALILPMAEGRYIPAGDAVWHDYLTGALAEINTTQDLSLPLWGQDHGATTLNWLLTTPYNNTLTFTDDAGGIAIAARHEFTRIDPTAPLTFTLHLGGADPLAGAKRYREWLIEEGRFEPLLEKLATTPDAEKLIGATHVYLWGAGLIASRDVTDWPGFLRLLAGDAPLAVALRDAIEGEGREMLAKVGEHPMAWQQEAIAALVNAGLDAMARERWMAEPEDAERLTASYQSLRTDFLETFGEALAPDPARWGNGEAVPTIEAIRDSGLQRLWIGLGEGWEGGLWHPEAIAAAVAAGYLVAPYDSYQDAMQPGHRTDWATAHLGQAAYDGCADIRKDGTPRSGFQGEGRYTVPDCVRPILEARVRAIRAAAGFNSWFLDSYAAGMLFDDYRPGREMTQWQHAAGNARLFALLNEELGLPTGSEDGNAATASGVLFGQGMQTPYIGWGDPELYKDQKSPYYVGGWWPGGEPAVFFRRVPLPERYRTLHFDPRFRLPLYEAVFHDSIVTTHHWSFDSLKFEGVEVERELVRLLYNVPGLYHLSAGTLKARLAAITRQDAFFRPLHEQLWDQALVGFGWLSNDHLLQRTEFSDGTSLVANFAGEARMAGDFEVPPRSITAFRPDGQPEVYTPEEFGRE